MELDPRFSNGQPIVQQQSTPEPEPTARTAEQLAAEAEQHRIIERQQSTQELYRQQPWLYRQRYGYGEMWQSNLLQRQRSLMQSMPLFSNLSNNPSGVGSLRKLLFFVVVTNQHPSDPYSTNTLVDPLIYGTQLTA
jgi:hypothetical protein